MKKFLIRANSRKHIAFLKDYEKVNSIRTVILVALVVHEVTLSSTDKNGS